MTRVRELARTLPYKARNGYCYVVISESENIYSKSVAVKFDNSRWFPESNWNSKQKDWLAMATFQEGTANFAVFCAIPALVVFSWIVHLFDSRDVGSFNFSSANIPFLDTNQTVPSQVRKVYEVLWSDPWNWNCYCYCVFSVFLFFLRHEAIAKTAEFHTHRIYQNMLSAQIVTIKNNSWKYSFATLCSSWKHSLKLVIVKTIV